jgi:hypothetical protein
VVFRFQRVGDDRLADIGERMLPVLRIDLGACDDQAEHQPPKRNSAKLWTPSGQLEGELQDNFSGRQVGLARGAEIEPGERNHLVP